MTSDDTGRWQRTVAIATAICLIVAVALLFWRPRVALGFAGGVITGAGTLSALVVVLNRVVVPSNERRGHPAPWIILHVGKFVFIAAFAFLIVETLNGSILAFAGGYTIALIVLFVVVAGRTTMSDRLAVCGNDSSEEKGSESSED